MLELSGLILGFIIGVGCRILDLPLPAPPKLTGALLVVVMTLGFIGAGFVLNQGTLAGSSQSVRWQNPGDGILESGNPVMGLQS